METRASRPGKAVTIEAASQASSLPVTHVIPWQACEARQPMVTSTFWTTSLSLPITKP